MHFLDKFFLPNFSEEVLSLSRIKAKVFDEFQTNLIFTTKKKHITKPSLVWCRPHDKSDCFVLCVPYRRSNLFETHQMVKVVQHCKNILSSYRRSNLFETRQMCKVVQYFKLLARLIKRCCKSSNTNCNTYIKLTAVMTAPRWCCQKNHLFTKSGQKSWKPNQTHFIL